MQTVVVLTFECKRSIFILMQMCFVMTFKSKCLGTKYKCKYFFPENQMQMLAQMQHF